MPRIKGQQKRNWKMTGAFSKEGYGKEGGRVESKGQ